MVLTREANQSIKLKWWVDGSHTTQSHCYLLPSYHPYNRESLIYLEPATTYSTTVLYKRRKLSIRILSLLYSSYGSYTMIFF